MCILSLSPSSLSNENDEHFVSAQDLAQTGDQ